ncbi:MAG: hypothetical protein ACPG66_03740 [Flavobacteriales bacterium]
MKRRIVNALSAHLEVQHAQASDRLISLQEALESESKSSAGDKHETGRARVHEEMRQVNQTLQRIEAQRSELDLILKRSSAPERVAPGVLVETDGPWVLMGLALGRMQVDELLVYSVSNEAPLAQAWRGALLGEKVKLGPSITTVRGLH